MAEAMERLDAVDLPRSVWSRSRRPIAGVALRGGTSLALVLFGFTFGAVPLRLAFLVLGVATFALVPVVTDLWFDRLGRRLAEAAHAGATHTLRGLDARRSVVLFAPHAWVQLQKGRLHLLLGEGRAAALAFAETARLCGDAKQPILLGAQAHACTRSGDRKAARELLSELARQGQLTPRDRLNLGIAYVEEPGRGEAAVQELEAARDRMGATPHVAVALALAYARANRIEAAEPMMALANAAELPASDVLFHDLLKRARKAMRQARPAEDRRSPRGVDAEPSEAATSSVNARETRRAKRKAARDKKATKKARGHRAPLVEKPEPLVARPELVTAEPETSIAEPLLEKREPLVARPELVAAELEPSIAEPLVETPEPIVAEPIETHPMREPNGKPVATATELRVDAGKGFAGPKEPQAAVELPFAARNAVSTEVRPEPAHPRSATSRDARASGSFHQSADAAWAELLAADEDIGPA